MKEVDKNLFVGDIGNCFYYDKPGWAVVHTCKHPCHQETVGYTGSLSNSHPNYLSMEKENHLFLNMVDMVKMPLDKFIRPILLTALDFIGRNIDLTKVMIHSNLGRSRAPIIALLFLSKRREAISNKSYEEARKGFIKLYSNYQPRQGLENYLIKYWRVIDEV